MKRRDFIRLLGIGAMTAALLPVLKAAKAFAADAITKLVKTDEEWKALLTPGQYQVLRHEATERPFTSALLNEHRTGTFACVGCDLPLFLSSAKFDSGTGWPSFFQAIDGHIETKVDNTLGTTRTEFHCARCDGHHGHIFNDGPQPTGLRHCCNGIVLKFIPA